jgi:hypothetical protein
MNLVETCKSKRLIEAEAKQKVFFATHKQCSKWKYVKLNENCVDKKPLPVKAKTDKDKRK